MVTGRPIPNGAAKTLLEAIQEVIGENGTTTIPKAVGLSRFVNNLPPNNTQRESTFADYGAAEQTGEDFCGARVFC